MSQSTDTPPSPKTVPAPTSNDATISDQQPRITLDAAATTSSSTFYASITKDAEVPPDSSSLPHKLTVDSIIAPPVLLPGEAISLGQSTDTPPSPKIVPASPSNEENHHIEQSAWDYIGPQFHANFCCKY